MKLQKIWARARAGSPGLETAHVGNPNILLVRDLLVPVHLTMTCKATLDNV